MEKLRTNRGLLKFILLSLITFGIYGIVCFSHISKEINTLATEHDHRRTMHYCLVFFLLSWLTLGIMMLIWWHNICDRIGDELKYRRIKYSFGAGSYWGWGFFGVLIIIGPFIFYHKFFKAMNLLNADYNKQMFGEREAEPVREEPVRPARVQEMKAATPRVERLYEEPVKKEAPQPVAAEPEPVAPVEPVKEETVKEEAPQPVKEEPEPVAPVEPVKEEHVKEEAPQPVAAEPEPVAPEEPVKEEPKEQVISRPPVVSPVRPVEKPIEENDLTNNKNSQIMDNKDSKNNQTERQGSGSNGNNQVIKVAVIVAAVAAVVAAVFGAISMFKSCEREEVKMVLAKDNCELIVHQADTLLVAFTPEGEELPVTYASDDESVAVVTSSGVVNALKEGTVNVTVTAQPKRGEPLVAVCQYVVKKEPEVKKTEGVAVGNLNLGYATYKGDVKNGKPHGNGTMTFKKRQMIPGTFDVQAYPGEQVIGVWRDGNINLGTLYQTNGNQVVIKYGQHIHNAE